MNPNDYFARVDAWNRVTSSNVYSIAHWRSLRNPDDQILGVRFNNGSEYWYYGASYGVFLAMLGSESKGRFVWRALRGRYRYQRMT